MLGLIPQGYLLSSRREGGLPDGRRIEIEGIGLVGMREHLPVLGAIAGLVVFAEKVGGQTFVGGLLLQSSVVLASRVTRPQS